MLLYDDEYDFVYSFYNFWAQTIGFWIICKAFPWQNSANLIILSIHFQGSLNLSG